MIVFSLQVEPLNSISPTVPCKVKLVNRITSKCVCVWFGSNNTSFNTSCSEARVVKLCAHHPSLPKHYMKLQGSRDAVWGLTFSSFSYLNDKRVPESVLKCQFCLEGLPD